MYERVCKQITASERTNGLYTKTLLDNLEQATGLLISYFFQCLQRKNYRKIHGCGDVASYKCPKPQKYWLHCTKQVYKGIVVLELNLDQCKQCPHSFSWSSRWQSLVEMAKFSLDRKTKQSLVFDFQGIYIY